MGADAYGERWTVDRRSSSAGPQGAQSPAAQVQRAGERAGSGLRAGAQGRERSLGEEDERHLRQGVAPRRSWILLSLRRQPVQDRMFRVLYSVLRVV